jgi:hypothetical protein
MPTERTDGRLPRRPRPPRLSLVPWKAPRRPFAELRPTAGGSSAPHGTASPGFWRTDAFIKSVREHMDVCAAYRGVGSYRAAADICGTTAKTVKRSVTAVRATRDGLGGSPGRVADNYDGVAELVAASVERTKGRITAKRLLVVAAAAGYVGSARNFRRLVADAKATWRAKNHRGRRPGVWGRAMWWCSTGDRSARCSCSAPCWPRRGCVSCPSPTTLERRRPWPAWPSVSRRLVVCRGWR